MPAPFNSFSRLSTSDAETALIGRSLGRILAAGDVVLLSGPLGAGKTTLARAIAEGMGVDTSSVASPTYVLVHEYRGAARAGTPSLIHVDAYRLRPEDDLDALGLDHFLAPDAPAAAMLVEWPERLGRTFPGAATIRIDHADPTSRELTFSLPETWSARPGFAALASRTATTCPITGRPVAPDSPTYPFADDRARMADLHRWFSGQYTVSRPLSQRDLEETE